MHTSPSGPRPLRVLRPSAGLRGDIMVPGDKSISHRSLMFAALARGESQVRGLLEGEDVLRTAAAMQALGAQIKRNNDGSWLITGRGLGQLAEPQDILDMGNSGTAARLLAGILASHDIMSVMTGDASLRKRPMGRVITPLRQTGATFMARGGERLPLAIHGAAHAQPLSYRSPVASAQVKSAVLLAGLNAAGVTRLEEPVMTRDHTENMLRHFGADIKVEPDDQGGCIISLQGQPELTGRDVLVPGDPSSAAFVIAAALLVPGSEVVVRNVGLNPLRTGLFLTLSEMGADITITGQRHEGGEPVGDLLVRSTNLRGVDVPAGRAPSMIDEYPILAVVAAHAQGESRLRGLHELRVKESDRLSATVDLLRANGVTVEVEGDDMIIAGTSGHIPGGGQIRTHMDHRLAMSGSVMGLVAAKAVDIDDMSFVDTSFPGYIDLMNTIGAEFGK